MGMSPRAPGGSKTNLEYMGVLAQNGNAGDMNKSITCKGHSTYLVMAGLTDGSHEKSHCNFNQWNSWAGHAGSNYRI